MAIQIYAAADRLLEDLGYPKDHFYRAESERQLGTTRSRMGEARFHAAWESGGALSVDQAVQQIQEFGFAALKTNLQTSRADQTLLVPLNEREIEVLRLIAEGLSNNEIAERLVIALSTVKWHINNLFGKLGVHSRTQAVAQAKELGLI